MHDTSHSRSKLTIAYFTRLLVFFFFWMAILFLPAGTLNYWQAWVFMALLYIPMIIGFIYGIIKDPKTLERRERTREKEPEQKFIIKLMYLWVFLAFLTPGFDQRFAWSHVPTWVVIIADICILAGFAFIFRVIIENQYASRIIEVEQGQKVITTGPYSIVRHPMYTGATLICIASPLALASYWAVITALFIIPVFVSRISNEEKVLVKELAGYEAYRQKTQYRLFPGIW